MTPERAATKTNSLKDNLNKALLEKYPRIELSVGCIDKHSEFSLEQKTQWLTFVIYQYDPIASGSIKKPKNYHDVSEILDIPETEIIQHIKSVLGDPNCDVLWEKLEKEIDLEAKKKPDLFKSSRVKDAPVSQEIIDKIIKLRQEGRPNAIIAQMVSLSKTRLHHLVRNLVDGRKIPARGHTKPRPSKSTL